ncbi:alpha-ketoacid dehydrogenase subunit beta [Mycoplasmoides pirum]|uniref:alpha-ketoacid dehydrogenase subunit beta n=1 Tax=Mycoplasmoides pirum TaxID=2122 RepID=UPI0004833F99|nr:alpha-ketoacid dehydrogenase subunit beta [Mycoplasmoides pirum]
MSKTITVNNIEALNNALDIALGTDSNVVLYGEDAGFEGGVFRATKGLQAKYGDKRVWDSPIAEAAIVGSAIGASMAGLKPIVEIQFSGFSFPSMMQLFSHAARFRNRTRGIRNVPIVVRMPMGGGIKALEHHSETLEALYSHIPGLKVVMPATPYDTKGLMLAAINDPDPVVFFEPKRVYRAYRQTIPEVPYQVKIGEANIIQPGNEITMVTYGPNVIDCWNLINSPEIASKYSIELIDLRTIKPWDQNTVLNSVCKTGRLIVVHEAVKSFGVGAEIIATVNDKIFNYLKTAPKRVTGFDITVPLAKGEQIQFSLENRIKDALSQMK